MTDTLDTRAQPPADALDAELSGLDALELPDAPARRTAVRLWSALWPKLAAIGLGLLLWQCVVWSGWKPEYLLPGPTSVLATMWEGIVDRTPEFDLIAATRITMWRAVVGFGVSLLIGAVIGALMSQVKVLRTAAGSLISGLQTMPSIAWFPLAILLFKISDATILFVMVIGAAPSIANGLLNGADQVPPVLRRAGRTMGAGRWALYRHVVLPGLLPSFIGGLKQGWAFSWRSLMAGELLVVIANEKSIGFLLQRGRDLNDAQELLAVMGTILVLGIVVDSLVFGGMERFVLKRRGLLVEDAPGNPSLFGRRRSVATATPAG